MPISDFIFAYFSPETLLPASSIVATIAGILLMVGRGSLRYVMHTIRFASRAPYRIASTSEPHLHLHDKAYNETPGS